jgi:hypothetical protein
VRLITTVPQELKEGLLRRLEGEDFKHAPTGNIISVLAAAADIAMAERAFLKLCELRRAITRAPDERHEFEWAIERQVEALLRAMPVNIAVAGVSNSFSKAPDAVELDVITRVFGSVGRSEPDGLADLDPEVRERFRTYLKNAVPLALQQDDFFGEYKANVASVLALVGTAADMKEMQELIRADIERVRRGRAARAGGDRSRLGNGGSLSYATWHIRALVRLAPVQSDSVLLDLLNEPEYERSVAEELARLVAPPKVEEGFIQKVDYERIWQARSGVREEPQAERRRRFAAAFRDRIEAIFKERSGSDQKRSYDFRLRVLGLALATIDSHGSSEMIFEIMSLPDEWDNWPRISAYEALLFNGVTLPADKTLALLDSCLDRFRKYGVQQQDEWMVIRFLCLLPFVDDPKKGIDKIRELISALRIHSHELGRVVEAMGHSRTDAALPFLRDLVSDSRVAQQLGDAWIRAVGAIDTADARDLLLSFVDPRLPALPVEVEFGRDDVLVARIVALMKRDRAVGQRVLQLCETEIPPAKRALLARVVSQFGSVEGVSAGLMLIDDAASPQVPYEIHQQLEAAFVEKRPYGGSENTYTLEPRSSNAIRTKLLEIAYRDERRRKSAFALLAQVEEWRLEYGRPTGEPRNPAFEEGEHWPPMPADA